MSDPGVNQWTRWVTLNRMSDPGVEPVEPDEWPRCCEPDVNLMSDPGVNQTVNLMSEPCC